MASGSANFSGAYGSHFRMEVNYGLVSQNIGGNSSVIRVWVNLYSDGYGSMYGVTAPLTISVNGGTAVHNVGVNINTNSAVTLFSKDYGIGHNDNGDKTVNINAKLAINIAGYGEASWGTNYDLPPIYRASTSSDITGTIETPLTININRASNSFTHTVKYNFGALTGTIGTGVGTSITWTPPMSLATALFDATSGWGNITIDTYNGSSKIGSKTYRMTLSVPESVVPSLGSITLTETNSIAKQLLNSDSVFVQNQSNIQVTFNSAVGISGSSISSYKAQIVGKGNSCSSNNSTLGVMNYSGIVTVEAWVVDSRGRPSNKVTKQITVIDYSPPAIYFTATRGNDTASANKVIISRTATISRLLVNNVQKNTFKLEFAYGTYGTSDRTPDSGANISQTTGTYSITRSDATMSADFDVGKSYKIYGRLTDAFGSTPWIEYEIHPERMVMGMAETTVSFGKYPEIANAVDSLWPYYYNNKPIQHYRLTSNDGRSPYNTSGTVDLNTKTVNSFFSCNEPINGPIVGTGPNQFYVSVYSESDNYLAQQAIQKGSGRMFTRTRDTGTWSNWIEYAPLNSVAEFTAVNQTKVYTGIINGPYGFNIAVTRSGNVVTATMDYVHRSNTNWNGTGNETIPVGWRPVNQAIINAIGEGGGGTGATLFNGSYVHLAYKPDGSISGRIKLETNPLWFGATISWITTDPFPSE
ncbi:DUF859 family phage minor structural protein [Streptococcus infantarius]|uniref:DUF859 family phage minor structural protein n=1 Tax=Streptococcus infantarius TaxID=102684 RepID=UPI003D0E81CE